MPRAPDPRLEKNLIEAALRLLDEEGLESVTMRSVAARAGTTTPTLYERFADRKALLAAVVEKAEAELIAAVQSAGTVRAFATAYIRFASQHSRRFDLTVDTFQARLASSQPTPVFDLLREVIALETRMHGRSLEDMALAIISLLIGTTRGMIAARLDHRRAGDLRRACLSALRLLLNEFRDN